MSSAAAEKRLSRAEKHQLLLGYLHTWGYVAAYREAGGIGYPPSLNGGNGGQQSNFGIPDLGAAYIDIQKHLKGTAPILFSLLFHMFVRPKLDPVEDGGELSGEELMELENTVDSYVETAYGAMLQPRQIGTITRILESRILRPWMRSTADALWS